MKKLFFISLCFSLLIVACKKDPTDPECSIQIGTQDRLFEFKHDSTGDTFLAWTNNAATILQVETQLALPEAQRNQHINGKILRLPEGCTVNQKWSWYFAPEEWVLADLSIEICDGNPQYVEENLNEYVNNVGSFCPWGSIVLREIEDR